MKSLFNILKLLGSSEGSGPPEESQDGPFPLPVRRRVRDKSVCQRCGRREFQLVRSIPSEGPFGLFSARDESWACDVCGETARRKAVE